MVGGFNKTHKYLGILKCDKIKKKEMKTEFLDNIKGG